MMPRLEIGRGDGSAALTVDLVDEGPSFRIDVGTDGRDFVDPDRRCDERARKAAVFTALVLEPPSVSIPVAPVPERIATPPRARTLPFVQLQVGALLEATRNASHGVVSAGGEARLFIGGRYVGATFGVSGLSPSTLIFGSANARLTLVPFDVGIRGRYRRGPWELGLDLALVLALQYTQGLAGPSSASATRLQAGLRASVSLEYHVSRRIVPYVATQVTFYPRAYDLTIPAQGTVGETPGAWGGFALGFAFDLR